MLVEQLVMLHRSATPHDNPRIKYQRIVADREAAYEQLCGELKHAGFGALRRFKSLYRAWEILGGYRETPKFCLIFAFDLLRQRLLREAYLLYRAGRLQRLEQIFDLISGIASNRRTENQQNNDCEQCTSANHNTASGYRLKTLFRLVLGLRQAAVLD